LVTCHREYFASLDCHPLNSGTYEIIPTISGNQIHLLPSSLWCNIFPRKFLEEIGGFDEDFGTSGWCLDDHLQMQLYTRGWKSVLQTDCLMYHVGLGSSSVRNQAEMTRNHYKACQTLRRKWSPRYDWGPYVEPMERSYKYQMFIDGGMETPQAVTLPEFVEERKRSADNY